MKKLNILSFKVKSMDNSRDLTQVQRIFNEVKNSSLDELDVEKSKKFINNRFDNKKIKG